MKANVTFKINGQLNTLEYDAADLNTIKNAVDDRRVRTQRILNTKVEVVSIEPI